MEPRRSQRRPTRLALGLALLLLAGCARAEEEGEETSPPEILLHGLVLRSYPEQGPPTVAHASRLSFDRNTATVVADELEVDRPENPDFPGRGGVKLRAPRGQGDIHGKGAILTGPVEAETGAGDRIRTVGVVWDGEAEVLTGEEKVLARGTGYSLSGGRFRYEHPVRELRLEGGVHLVSVAGSEVLGAGRPKRLQGEKGKNPQAPADRPPSEQAAPAAEAAAEPPPIDLQSPSMTVEHRRRRAVFHGGVVLRRGDLVVRCPELVAHYDRSGNIRRVVCEGPVEAQERTRTMRAAGGSFDNVEGLLRLDGDPVIEDGERRLEGESMVYEVEARRARVLRGVALLPAVEAPFPRAGPGGPMRVSAEQIVYEVNSRTTAFDGKVVARRGKMDLHASRLVTVAGEDGKLEKAWTEGGPVTAVEGPRRATAGRASFVGRGSRLVLEGDPLLTEGSSTLRGKRVVFHLGEERVEVEQPRAAFPLDEAVPGVAP